ncbi:MAG: thioredoxin TrxC [Magnetococcales bacterium]|nr:thioredoxin TrxC [Magnetococcales bacterium]
MNETFQIVCPSCAATNRLRRDKPAMQSTCGRCRERIFQGAPVNLTAESFHRHVSNNHIPVLVDFWAEWCGPCKMMAPVFAQAAAQLEPNLRVAKLNTEQERMIATEFGIQSIPTLVLFRDGREMARQSGAMPLNALLAWVRQHLN